ncbi:hypothetical protein YC2023_053499 [Brassica napus]
MVIEKRLLELVLKIEACDTMENEETCRQKMDALLLFSPHSWQLGKKCDSSCFFTLNRSSLGLDSLVFSVMEPTYLQNLSLGLDDSLAGSIVLSMEVLSMEVFRFISSCTNLYSDTQDSPTVKNSLTFFQRVGHSMFTGSYSLFDPLSFPLLLYMLTLFVVVLMLSAGPGRKRKKLVLPAAVRLC